MPLQFIKNPVTRKRIARFGEHRLACWSLWILLILYGASLGCNLLSNNLPLYVRFEGKSYFPIFKYYPEKTFLRGGEAGRPDYRKLAAGELFNGKKQNFMLFPPHPFDPFESVDPASLGGGAKVRVDFHARERVATINIREDYTIARQRAFALFTEQGGAGIKGRRLTEFYRITGGLEKAIRARFANSPAESAAFTLSSLSGTDAAVSLSRYAPRKNPPKTVRLTFREPEGAAQGVLSVTFEGDGISGEASEIWNKLPEADRTELLARATARREGEVDPLSLNVDGELFTASFQKDEVRFPFPPTRAHPMGIDGAGRDVLSRILYGLRISMTFGLILVVCSMALGSIAGALQGYFGGVFDITCQRLIEIWSALPFLYIMILMGSVYGRGFYLLLICYGLFNWIGISYYVRAEFLRLRRTAFVEAARCMGIPWYRIITRHIMPNAMVPVITFFPFSLVGAVGSLAALDYLGFGLPPPTPSWGELLFQAQQYRWAWWLIVYPSLALFTVMLLGVFVGEGVRGAYDPKRYTRLE